MPPRRPVAWVPRPSITQLLASPHPIVALVGPLGSGRSSLLADFAHHRTDVGWVEAGAIPDLSAGYLLLDDAEQLPQPLWEELDRRLLRHPDLLLRIAVTTPRFLPADWDVTIVGDLSWNHATIAGYLTQIGATGDPALVELVSGGHAQTVRWVANTPTRDPDQLRAKLALRAEAQKLPPEWEILGIPDHLTAPLVEQLGGTSGWLVEAERMGWGRWLGDPAEQVFQLTPGIREATRAASSLSAQQRLTIHALAARVLLKHGAGFPALREAVRAGDLDTADLALKAAGTSVLRTKNLALMELLRPLSLGQLRKYPVLAFALALLLNAQAIHRLRAVELFGVALIGIKLGAGHAADRVILKVLESAALRVLGTDDGGLRAAKKAIINLQELEPSQRTRLGRTEATLHNQTAISLLYGGLEDEAQEQFELALGTSTPPLNSELLSHGGLAFLDALRGETHQARRRIRETLQRPWPLTSLNEYAGGLLRLAETQVALDDFDFTAAQTALQTIWPIVDTLEHWPFMARQQALIDIASQQPAEGLERFRALRHKRVGRFGTTTRVARLLAVVEAMLLIADGRSLQARKVLGSPRDAMTSLVAAMASLHSGDPALALQQLVRTTAHHPRERMLKTCLEAITLQQLGQEERARTQVKTATAIWQAHGVRSPLLMIPAGSKDLFGELMVGAPGVLAAPVELSELSERELVVLKELAQTSRLLSIAERLHVSENTVKSQRRTLYRKLGVTSRQDALAEAAVRGLLDS